MHETKIALTLTGAESGRTLCGVPKGAAGASHATWTPIERPEVRERSCPACLREYAESYREDDGTIEEGAPDWVRAILAG